MSDEPRHVRRVAEIEAAFRAGRVPPATLAPRPTKPRMMPWGPPRCGEPKARPAVPQAIGMVVDMHAGRTPLTRRTVHHQSFDLMEHEGAI